MRKLTEPDKQLILKLYRTTGETTSTLAERYGVSNSTISRLLKSTLPEDEYEYLVSLKRAARTPGGAEEKKALIQQQYTSVVPPSEPQQVVLIEPKQPLLAQQPTPQQQEDTFSSTSASRRVRKRSSSGDRLTNEQPQQLELLDLTPASVAASTSPLDDDVNGKANVIAEMLGEDLLDEDDEVDLEDDEDEEDFDDDEDDEEAPPLVRRRISPGALVQVLPLSAAHLPKTCYLVIDRASELITRPLRDFGDLGQIPNPETQQRTLPVFDNHRVAKRFSTKRDRVIKIPDSKMLHKARYHLQAKGITRLLIDGQVYSLSPV